MVIVLTILVVCAVLVGIFTSEDYEITSFIAWVGAVCIGILEFIALLALSFNAFDMVTIKDKIKMYEEENRNIEQQMTEIVSGYMGYETEIINSVSKMEVYYLKVPELKASELVKTQMGVYIANNNKLKELKEKDIDTKAWKWLLYFGG